VLNSSPKMAALSILRNDRSYCYKSRVLLSGDDWVCEEVKVVPLKRQQEKAVVKIINLVSLAFDVFQPLTGFGYLHSQKLAKTMEV